MTIPDNGHSEFVPPIPRTPDDFSSSTSNLPPQPFLFEGHLISSQNLGAGAGGLQPISAWVPTIDGHPFPQADTYLFMGSDEKIYQINLEPGSSTVTISSTAIEESSGFLEQVSTESFSLYAGERFFTGTADQFAVYTSDDVSKISEIIDYPCTFNVKDTCLTLFTDDQKPQKIYIELTKLPSTVSPNSVLFDGHIISGQFIDKNFILAIDGQKFLNSADNYCIMGSNGKMYEIHLWPSNGSYSLAISPASEQVLTGSYNLYIGGRFFYGNSDFINTLNTNNPQTIDHYPCSFMGNGVILTISKDNQEPPVLHFEINPVAFQEPQQPFQFAGHTISSSYLGVDATGMPIWVPTIDGTPFPQKAENYLILSSDGTMYTLRMCEVNGCLTGECQSNGSCSSLIPSCFAYANVKGSFSLYFNKTFLSGDRLGNLSSPNFQIYHENTSGAAMIDNTFTRVVRSYIDDGQLSYFFSTRLYTDTTTQTTINELSSPTLTWSSGGISLKNDLIAKLRYTGYIQSFLNSADLISVYKLTQQDINNFEQCGLFLRPLTTLYNFLTSPNLQWSTTGSELIATLINEIKLDGMTWQKFVNFYNNQDQSVFSAQDKLLIDQIFSILDLSTYPGTLRRDLYHPTTPWSSTGQNVITTLINETLKPGTTVQSFITCFKALSESSLALSLSPEDIAQLNKILADLGIIL